MVPRNSAVFYAGALTSRQKPIPPLINTALRFRWVVCQMDYLCELPNDAARRRALERLPPTLKATYERILQKVNDSSGDVQQLVQRTLHWIIHNPRISISALCEAVSVETGQRMLDIEAIPTEEEILRRCSSLVRRSVSGQNLELAHFTVKEFLTSDGTHSNDKFCAYYVSPPEFVEGTAAIAKVYLRYLLFKDFSKFDWSDSCQLGRKDDHYALLSIAVSQWHEHARNHLDDPEVLHMVQELLHPSKSNNFMNWACQFTSQKHGTSSHLDYPASCSPLHYAASFSLRNVLTWLVKSGCRVNQNSLMGNPLHCAFWGWDLLCGNDVMSRKKSPASEKLVAATVHTLLDLGADPSCCCNFEGESWTPYELAFVQENREACVSLLKQGAAVNKEFYIRFSHAVMCKQIIDDIGQEHLQEETYALLLKSAGEPETCEAQAGMSHALQIAARAGQWAWIQTLVQDSKANVNATDPISGSTALIESCKMDHVDVVRCLLHLGADPNIMDSRKRLPIHYAVQADGCQCLPIMLRETANISARDSRGNNLWHLAAEWDNTEALQIIMNHAQDRRRSTPIVEGGRSAQEHFTGNSSFERSAFLREHSCDEWDLNTRNNDELTPLHLAVGIEISDATKLLVVAGADPGVALQDGSSLLHYANASGPGAHTIINTLVEVGVDPRTSNKNGDTPLHELMMCAGVSDDNDIKNAKLVLHILAQQGATVNQPNAKGQTPLHLLCHPSSAALSMGISWEDVALGLLLGLSADLSLRDSNGQTPLDLLTDAWEQEYVTQDCSKRSPVTRRSRICARLMKRIVDHVVSVDVSQACLIPWGARLLFLALWLKEDTLSHSILEQQPDVESPVGFVELSPIECACLYGCSNSLLKRLLEASTFRSIPTALGVRLMILLCQDTKDRNDCNLSDLISNGFDPNGSSPDGTTALMIAAESGKLSFVETLLCHGAQPSTKNSDGWNAAHRACLSGQLNVLYALHKRNIAWNDKVSAYFSSDFGGVSRRRHNVSMLHIAARQENSKIVAFLLNKHLVEDINSITDYGETALHIASCHGIHDNVALLLGHNADYSMFSKQDESPIHLAAKFGRLQVVESFVSQNCQTRLPNSAGLTPELYARKYGHSELVDVLRCRRVEQGMYRPE